MSNMLLLEPGELLQFKTGVTIDSHDLHSNKWCLHEAVIGPVPSWPVPDFTFDIPAGTVCRVGNYKIRLGSNPRYSYIPLLVMDSPERRFMPKSRGGTGRRVNIYMPFFLFKELDIERYSSQSI
jgi:hypothetical protein